MKHIHCKTGEGREKETPAPTKLYQKAIIIIIIVAVVANVSL